MYVNMPHSLYINVFVIYAHINEFLYTILTHLGGGGAFKHHCDKT